MRRACVVLALLAAVVACDSKSPTAPTRPSPTPTVPPAPTVAELTIGGSGAFSTLSQVRQLTATALMTDGTVRDVTADATWSSSNAEVVTVSSTGEAVAVGLGFATIGAKWVIKEASLDVSVTPAGDPSRVSGLYRLTVSAAPGCAALPEWARRREYDATIDQPGTESRGQIASLTLSVRLEAGSAPQFSGWIDGSRVTFSLPGGSSGGGFYYYYYAPTPPTFSYSVDADTQYTLAGEARGTKGPSHDVQIAGTINGVISVLNPSTDTTVGDCSSASHQFTLARR